MWFNCTKFNTKHESGFYFFSDGRNTTLKLIKIMKKSEIILIILSIILLSHSIYKVVAKNDKVKKEEVHVIYDCPLHDDIEHEVLKDVD